MQPESTPTLRRPMVVAVLALVGLLPALLWPQPALADRHGRIVAPGGVALDGFDPVAYFQDGAARPGDPAIALRWRGVRWHFTTPTHRSAFEANPKAYLPAFGGHCPVSVAGGDPRPADPRHWAIVEGRLYIAAEPAALARFKAHADRLRQAAKAQWTGPPRLAVGD